MIWEEKGTHLIDTQYTHWAGPHLEDGHFTLLRVFTLFSFAK